MLCYFQSIFSDDLISDSFRYSYFLKIYAFISIILKAGVFRRLLQRRKNMIKDLTTKRCLSDNERYADLINGAVFGGRQLLKPQDLTDEDSHAILRHGKASGRKKNYKPRYHDLIKKAAFGVNFAVTSLEDPDKVHYLMPLRNMAYEAAEYDRQAQVIRGQVHNLPDITGEEFLSGFLKDSRLWPCITFVLYFGPLWQAVRTSEVL